MTTVSEPLTDSQPRLLRACRAQPVDRTPVWLMRQAGRYMSQYRDLRSQHSLLDIIRSPELAAEVTLQPIDAFDLDAAIIFSDLLPPLVGMGLQLEYRAGDGPVITNPIRRPYDVDVLAAPPAAFTLKSTLDAIRLVKQALTPRGIPLLGFAGAPFTLACYAIEGGSSQQFATARAFMYAEPAAWKRLMTRLVTVSADFLLEQIKAGADAVQVFDTWAGLLSAADYRRYVAPYNTMLFLAIARAGVPVINFSTGTAAILDDVAACGGDVIGIDWRIPLETAWSRIPANRAVMGNLDPVTLFAPWRELRRHVDDVLRQAKGKRGYIFNLGHGILPKTPVDNVRRVIDYVHEQTERTHG